MNETPILAICDRCRKEIMKNGKEEFLTLTAKNIRWEKETYELHFLLCPECRKEFKKWVFLKEDTA